MKNEASANRFERVKWTREPRDQIIAEIRKMSHEELGGGLDDGDRRIPFWRRSLIVGSHRWAREYLLRPLVDVARLSICGAGSSRT